MFSGGNEQCAFRKALEVVFHQLLKVACSSSLSHMVGLIVTNTEKSKNRNNQQFCYEWIELGILSREDVIPVKEMLDSADIHASFLEVFGGHASSDLANVLWSCKKVMTLSATAYRHHLIMYLSNQVNPFGDDPAAYQRVKQIVKDFSTKSYTDRNGMRKKNKTPGELHVLLLVDDVADEDRDRWVSITPNIAVGTEDLDLQAYKKTFSQRAFSNVTLDIGEGVRMSLGVYTLAAETRPPVSVLLDAETEGKVARKVFWLPKAAEGEKDGDDDEAQEDEGMSVDSSSRSERDSDVRSVLTDPLVRSRGELEKAIRVGGESIVSRPEELEQLRRFDAKGIVLLGFKPLSELNLLEHVQTSQFIYPDDDSIRGSQKLYRALLRRCLDRQMAMICRFCSRSNQKVRIVALVPDEKVQLPDDLDEKQRDALNTANEYRQSGFHVVFLPFAEDRRDISDKMDCPLQGENWPQPSQTDIEVSKKFVRNLTQPYAPESFYNPRLRSFNAMLIEAAVGQKTPVEDNLLPYHKIRSDKFVSVVAGSLTKHFQLAEDQIPANAAAAKRTAGAGGSSADGAAPKRSKKEDVSALSIEDLARQGKLSQLTVVQLRAAYGDHLGGRWSRGDKKSDLVATLEKHFQSR